MSVLDAFSLAGKVSVVTGANRGIGRALSVALAEAGSDVVLLVRDPDRATDVVDEVTALGVQARAVAADVTDPAGVRRAVDEVLAGVGRVDVLINNAGTCIHAPALEVTDEDWQTRARRQPQRRVELRPVVRPGHGGGRPRHHRQHRVDLGPDRQPSSVAAGVQRLQGGGAPPDQVAGRRMGAARHPGQRPGAGLHQDRDGPGRRAAVSAGCGSTTPRCSVTPHPASSGRA